MTCADLTTNALGGQSLIQEQLNSLSLFVKEILVHVWTIAENTSNATKRVRWVPKTKGDDRPGRIGKESPNLDVVIGRAISESLLWSCHEHSEGCVKPLYDSKTLTVSSKTIVNMFAASYCL